MLAIAFETNCKAVEEPFIHLLFLKMFFMPLSFKICFSPLDTQKIRTFLQKVFVKIPGAKTDFIFFSFLRPTIRKRRGDFCLCERTGEFPECLHLITITYFQKLQAGHTVQTEGQLNHCSKEQHNLHM